MIQSVDFLSRKDAEARGYTPGDIVISIGNPAQWPARIRGAAAVLRQEFLDLDEPQEHPGFEPGFMFQPEQAREIADWVRHYHAQPDPYQLIIHCEAGSSRSAAVALAVEALACCKFPRRVWASYANPYVLAVFAAQGICADRPAQDAPWC